MFSVFSAVDQPFKTIMAVTHDRIDRIPAAVFFHYVILFVQGTTRYFRHGI